ncbi:MAG: division/cell wall cluster transcriptional repressor MraZ [Chthoniobacterales bacterium]
MEPASSNSSYYAGEFRHQLDDKHRITIPSRWRRSGAVEEFLMVPEASGQFLLVMPPKEFERISAAAENTPGVSPRDLRIYLRQLHSQAQHGASDKQGRLLLPDDLCKKLELKGEVALVGGRGRFEIWNLRRRQAAHTEEHPTYQHVANLVGL